MRLAPARGRARRRHDRGALVLVEDARLGVVEVDPGAELVLGGQLAGQGLRPGSVLPVAERIVDGAGQVVDAAAAGQRGPRGALELLGRGDGGELGVRRIGAERAAAVSSVFGAPAAPAAGTGAAR